MAGCRTRTSQFTSALAERPLSWLYPYREDAQSTRLDAPVFRPFVPISLAHGEQSTWQLTGLVDTGADAILASNLLAEQLELDLDNPEGEATHAVGGRVVIARYKTISLRLHPSDADEGAYREWRAEVGFIEGWHSRSCPLGKRGFPRSLHRHREPLLSSGRSRGSRQLRWSFRRGLGLVLSANRAAEGGIRRCECG